MLQDVVEDVISSKPLQPVVFAVQHTRQRLGGLCQALLQDSESLCSDFLTLSVQLSLEFRCLQPLVEGGPVRSGLFQSCSVRRAGHDERDSLHAYIKPLIAVY